MNRTASVAHRHQTLEEARRQSLPQMSETGQPSDSSILDFVQSDADDGGSTGNDGGEGGRREREEEEEKMVGTCDPVWGTLLRIP